jgi:hypothetical protein
MARLMAPWCCRCCSSCAALGERPRRVSARRWRAWRARVKTVRQEFKAQVHMELSWLSTTSSEHRHLSSVQRAVGARCQSRSGARSTGPCSLQFWASTRVRVVGQAAAVLITRRARRAHAARPLLLLQTSPRAWTASTWVTDSGMMTAAASMHASGWRTLGVSCRSCRSRCSACVHACAEQPALRLSWW